MSGWPFRRAPGPGQLGREEEEVREELELYLELRAEELQADEGLAPEEARREAERRFGDRDEIERRVRRERARHGRDDGRMTMGQLAQDIRYAIRSFARSPGFTAVAVLTLALAVAGNTAIFSVLDEAVLQALPFPDHEELVFVRGYHDTNGERGYRMASVPEFLDWRERARSLDPLVGVTSFTVTLTGESAPERVQAEVVSSGYFRMLGGEAALGRTFTAAEADTPGGPALLVLSDGLWRARFGGDPEVVGRTVQVNEEPFTILGVMPPDFEPVGLEDIRLWIPLGWLGEGAFQSRGGRFLPAAGRLAQGFTVEQAQAELDAIARDLQEAHPRTHEDRWAAVIPFREGYLGTTGTLLWILLGGGVLLLAIASANVANLLLVRAHGRTRELTVRRAMGAGSGRLVRQLLTESVALAAIGGAVGLLLAFWGIGALGQAIPDGVLPAYAEPGISARVFLVTLGVMAGVGVLAGLFPALSSARAELAATLRAGTGGTTGASGRRVQRLFVVTQVALALLLMVGAGLLTRSARAQLAVDPGVEIEGIHVFRVQPPQARYPDAAALRVFGDELVRSVESLPGVRSVAVASDIPFRGGSSGAYIFRPDAPDERIRYHRHMVSDGYFELMGIRLLAGRAFEAADDRDTPGVAVVPEVMVRRVFPELDDATAAVGRTIYVGPPSDPDNAAEIVGVIENVRYRNLTQDLMAEPNSPDVFFSMRQVPFRSHEVALRSEQPLGALLPSIRAAVAELDPDLPLYQAQTLEDAWRAQTATPRFAAFLMGLFGVLALSLACVGIYGVLAFAVGQRGREIAVRRALGAEVGEVARSVVWDGVRLALVGLVVGGAAAALGTRYLEDFLFGVEPGDPVTYGAGALLMLLVVVAAASVPAWRATRKDPVEALSAE